MTIEKTEPEMLTFDCIHEAIEHVQKLEKEASEAVAKYRVAVSEFAGIQPGQQIGPMDVIKMIIKFREAK